jgi:LPXTG-motif cell wall-anchored protein
MPPVPALTAEPSRAGSLADTGGPSALLGLLGLVITALGVGLLIRRRWDG